MIAEIHMIRRWWVRRRVKRSVLILVLCVCGAAGLFARYRESRAARHVFNAEAWCEVRDATLELRLAQGDHGDLLIRLKLPSGVLSPGSESGELELVDPAVSPSRLYTYKGNQLRDSGAIRTDRPPTSVYRFAADSSEFELANGDDWIRAGSAVCKCAEQTETLGRWGINTRVGGISRYGRRDAQHVETAGEQPVRLAHSPSGRFVAVISGDGVRRPLMPFMGGPTVSGPFYHQVFEESTGIEVGAGTPLPRIAKEMTTMCWAPEDRYVVYATPNCCYLRVLAVEGGGADR